MQTGLRKAVAELEINLVSAGGAGPAKQAPRFTVQMLVEFEVAVMNSARPAYQRAFAWWCLLSVWAALRFDDHRGLTPQRVHRRLAGVEFSLTRSKTTGAGKKFAERPGYVSLNAYIKEPDWLLTGLDLWESFGKQVCPVRDYWLMLPTIDLGAARAVEMKYPDASAATRALMLTLGDQHSGVGIIPFDAVAFWTLHSPRAWLPSAAAAVGFNAEWIDSIAAWRPQGGTVYVRTTRRRIQSIQEKVAEQIRQAEGLEDILDEEEIFEQLAEFMAKKEEELDTAPLRFFKLPARGIMQREELQPKLRKTASAQVAETIKDETVSKGTEGDYIVSVTEKQGFRRLHQLGRCFRIPGVHYTQWEVLGLERPETSEYEDYCKNCWPQKKARTSRQGSSGSSSSDSSSGSSSSEAAEQP
jgi:hypothetical protein